ncbi:osmotically inducible protein C [Chlorobium phaeovibrioides]|uniref:Osmotically inducible protein C n=2 Tax=Chlorobium phaeovibrioides TaxID=1094 RepID=A0A432AX77_CHLPH|nr:OsmC family protein [Chlorobium phaeovibrioides]HCD35524.1 osmotically inducible protein C [Chlorobium sp.]KAA6232464.1 osmotically inducible protein C [Chlorobium phaeovibrioides]MWV54319.1 osmotically inducible protein C [Chlorobium phaeovibrioides]QEQ57059.1 osmotically inducible protein C [Chlorobium phaeovibrioides]RTY35028.1 osmotically inducible protein C [Chlorobium phaeovibrioides]
MGDNMVISFGGGKKVNASYRGFTIQTDQSVNGGGEGSAPEPFALFLASIGTCAGIYVFLFCEQRGIPTDNIRIVQSHEPREDGTGVGKISLSIDLPSDFPAKYRTAVISAANLCAVKKHILDPPVFEVAATIAEG